jgi:hypothetical protein
MRPIFPALLIVAFSGCITLQAFKDTASAVTSAQGDIVEGINDLDRQCQAAAKTEKELEACRAPRDRARQAMRRQLAAFAKGSAK